MAFALQPNEPLTQGVLRLVLGQFDSAVSHLAAQESDPVETVHEVRKSIKRLRTSLRLLRQAFGKAAFRQENACLAASAQKLAAMRDTHMLVEATARLAKHLAGSPYAEAVEPVKRALEERHKPQPLSEELLHDTVVALQDARQRLEERLLALSTMETFSSLRTGIRRMLRRSRRAYALAYAEPTDEAFHEWRKRIKDLYYTAGLLHLTRPDKLAPIVDKLDETAEALGDEHDLGLLATVLHKDPNATGGAVPVALMLQVIARRREELRQALRSAGQELHKRPPKRMARFMLRGLET